MNLKKGFFVKLIHCGNRSIANPDDTREKSIFFMPMGLFSMARILEQKGFDVEIIHLDLEFAPDIEGSLDFDRVDAVGLDCHWANQALVVMETAALIKKKKPSIFLFLGGYTASFFVDEILRHHPAVDAVIRGDGEVPIGQLCDYLYNRKGTLEKVQNLAWRGENREIMLNDLTYIATNREMEQFDFDALDLLRNQEFYRDLCKYWTKFTSINRLPLFLLEIGRGCIYTCPTCGGNAQAQHCISKRNGQVTRSPGAVIASIKKALGFGFSCYMVSFEFEGSDEWYIELFKMIKQQKLTVNFVYESWGLPSKQLIDSLAESCENALVTISPETADFDLRKKNKDKRKIYSNPQLQDCLDYIGSKNNLKAQLYFGYFLPFDTAAAIFDTMNYITKLFRKYSNFSEFIYMNFNTDPCSSLYLTPAAYEMDVKVRTFNDYKNKLAASAITLFSHPAQMTEAQAVNLANKVHVFNKLFYFGKSITYLLNRVNRDDIFSRYLEEIDLTHPNDTILTLAEVKNSLLHICKTHLPSNKAIDGLISQEYEQITSSRSQLEHLTSGYTLGSNTDDEDYNDGRKNMDFDFDL
jgi:radical SAM superfamily enzyme YgiQ (UPF0313 family)